MKFVRNTTLLGIILGTSSLFAQATTMADAQKAYVAGQWKEAATAYEQVCPTVADSAKTECYLWSILALSQTGSADDFKKSGRRLDSLIKGTNPQKSIYSDLLMTRAQFQMYLGKFDNASKALVSAIETSGPQQKVALQKVCGALQPKAKSATLDSACARFNTPPVQAPVAKMPTSVSTSPSSDTAETTSPTTTPITATPTSTASMPAVTSTATPPTTVTPAPIVRKQDSTAITAPKAQATPAVAVPPQDAWYLQLGAFGVKSNADLLVKNMKKRGIICQIEERAGETKTLYIVNIPDFATKEAAVDFAAKKLTPIKVDFQVVKKK